MKNYQSFDLIEKISFERIGGSKKELKAAQFIQSELKKEQIDSSLESFEVDYHEIKEAKLEVIEPFKKTYLVTGYGMSGSTVEDGIIAPLVYIENGLEVNLIEVKDKIVLINGRMAYKLYEKLIKAEVKGFISISGSVYDDINQTDLEERSLRHGHYQHGKIPGVTIRIKDAEEIISLNGTLVKLTLLQKEGKRTSNNLVTTIKGTKYTNNIVAFTAHYDSVRFSPGAFDNATGSAAILELLRHFSKNPPLRTLKFVWCGSEEMGLLGSKAYVQKHLDDIPNYEFVINVDMIGVILGYDIAVCTAEASLVDYINYLGKEVGFPIKSSQGVYSSDSTPFADAGVPAMSFARLSTAGGAEIHSRKDLTKFLDAKNYYKTCRFMIEFSNRIVNSIVMPIPRTIPENMKLELDYYNLRKTRPEK